MLPATYIGLCKKYLSGCDGIFEGVYVLKDSEDILYSHRYTMEWILQVVANHIGVELAELKLSQQVEQDIEGVTLKYVVSKYYQSFDCVCLSSTEKRLLPKLVQKLLSSAHIMGIPHIIIIRNSEILSRQILSNIRALLLKYKCLCFFITHINPSVVLRVFESLAVYVPIRVKGDPLIIPAPKYFYTMLNGKMSVREFVTKHIMSGDIPWRVLWNWVLQEGDKRCNEAVYLKLLDLAAMFDKKPKTQIVLETFIYTALKEFSNIS
jgi:hypothetical protein